MCPLLFVVAGVQAVVESREIDNEYSSNISPIYCYLHLLTLGCLAAIQKQLLKKKLQ